MQEINYPNIASMVFGTPLLATPELLSSVKQVLLPRMAGTNITNIVAPTTDVREYEAKDRVGLPVSNGIAIISVNGILATRRGTITAECSEMISYEYLASQLQAALDNENVEEIVFDMNSHGGAALGAFEFADRIFEARGQKPMTAIINFSAYSAGYLIPAACDKVLISKTGGAGSIGVIAEHAEYSKAIEDAGWKFTPVFRGAHKNDLTPHEPITDQGLKVLQESVDEYYEMFVDSVARYRGMSTASVIETEAATYRGKKAIKAGLADELMTPQDAINVIAVRVAKQKAKQLAESHQITSQNTKRRMKARTMQMTSATTPVR